MNYKRIVLGISLIFLMAIGISAAQEAEKKVKIPEPQHKEDIGLRKLEEKINTISVLGRLSAEKHGQDEWLVLHAKDAETYLITGGFGEKLKNSLLELGENNLVFVTGIRDGRSHISCGQSYEYKSSKKDERQFKIDTKCIRYYDLRVIQILFAKKSDEEIPPPKRDIDEERRLIKTGGPQALIPVIMGEIYGKITGVNLESPIKTVEIANLDKDSPLQSITLLIGPDSRIAKKIGKEEPMALSVEALKTGQAVTAIYSKGELKNDAIFITITKE